MLRDITHPSKQIITRGDSITLPGTINGLYNQLLFDLCSDDSLVALSLFGTYNPAIDAIGVVNSKVDNIHKDMLVYVAADGAAAASPTSGRQTDPCADGNSFESGTCHFTLSGWGRLRRSSEGRDITDENIRYCETQPRYNIAGQPIDNDYEWDLKREMTVLLQDFQRELIVGNSATGGSADGLDQLVVYGYTDPDTSEACTSMDSTVVNWNGNSMCDPNGADGTVTVNGTLIAAGYVLLDIIKSFLNQTRTRIKMSSLSGTPFHMAMMHRNAVRCLIDCYVCDVACGSDIERMDSFEARKLITDLRKEFGENDAVVLTFEGIPVVIYDYDWELYDTVSDNHKMFFLTPKVGNEKLIDIQFKDMQNSISATQRGAQLFKVTDNNRVLSWETYDHTCYKIHAEMQWRVEMTAPWAQMVIDNVDCSDALGTISADPLSTVFIEQNLVASPEV
jgi:hypothetical protein